MHVIRIALFIAPENTTMRPLHNNRWELGICVDYVQGLRTLYKTPVYVIAHQKDIMRNCSSRFLYVFIALQMSSRSGFIYPPLIVSVRDTWLEPRAGRTRHSMARGHIG